MFQRCFRGLTPPVPTIRTPRVAWQIAERIVKEVNLDDFCWEPEEVPDRIADIAEEIIRNGRPRTVILRLRRKQPSMSDKPYGWECIDEHCRQIAGEIADEELEKAIEKHWREFRRQETQKCTAGVMPGAPPN